jgi:antirestriction protein
MINLYISTYHKYNSGYLNGEWVELPLDEDKLEETLNRIKGLHPAECDAEFMIQDYETDLNIKIEESSSIYELNELAQKTDNWTDTEKEVFGCMVEDWGRDIEDASEKVENRDYYFIEAESDAELGENYIDQLGGLDCLSRETIERYFDFEAFGRDLSFDFTKTDNGYLADN